MRPEAQRPQPGLVLREQDLVERGMPGHEDLFAVAHFMCGFPGSGSPRSRSSNPENRSPVRVSAGVPIEKIANWLGDTIQVAWRNYSRFLPVDHAINLGAA
jgi:hypothetical protein